MRQSCHALHVLPEMVSDEAMLPPMSRPSPKLALLQRRFRGQVMVMALAPQHQTLSPSPCRQSPGTAIHFIDVQQTLIHSQACQQCIVTQQKNENNVRLEHLLRVLPLQRPPQNIDRRSERTQDLLSQSAKLTSTI